MSSRGGRTAVPCLSAKPIINMAVAAPSAEVVPRLKQPLVDLGYIHRGGLVGVVTETVQPAHVSLWLRSDTVKKGEQTH
jgi:GrpB-like predicted nucleotidyltransferase (UPF0157 family)